MAVPTERTWVDADSVDTTTLNAGVRDPITFLMERPIAQMRQTVSQNVLTSTFSALTFTTEDVDDPAGQHDTGSNTSRFTAAEDGWYQISGKVAFESNATGVRVARWTKNGTAINGGRTDYGAFSGQILYPANTMLVSLSASDFVELEAWQNSGGTRATVVTTENQSTMTVVWVRRL